MTMVAPKTFSAGDELTAADLNAHVTGSYPTALGAAVDGAGNDMTAMDEIGFSDAAANASAAGRLRRNGANLTWHDGTSAINLAGLAAASQAQMEAATINTVAATPGTTQYHPGIAKAWVYYTNVAGVPTIQVSYNVTSLTDNGVGVTTVNFTTGFSSANYAVVASNHTFTRGNAVPTTRAVGSIRIELYDDAGAAADGDVSVLVFGDQS